MIFDLRTTVGRIASCGETPKLPETDPSKTKIAEIPKVPEPRFFVGNFGTPRMASENASRFSRTWLLGEKQRGLECELRKALMGLERRLEERFVREMNSKRNKRNETREGGRAESKLRTW
jgi:hypothetical protein